MADPAAARWHDPVSHNEAATGFLAGSVAGGLAGWGITAGVGTAVEVAVAAGALTGGVGTVVVLGGMLLGAAAAFGLQKLGAAIGSAVPSGSTGRIASGSANVRINGLAAAFVTAAVDCHDGEQVATGAATVRINGRQAARVGSRTTQNATIVAGSPDVLVGGAEVSVLAVKPWGLGTEILGDVLTAVPDLLIGGWKLGAMGLRALSRPAAEGMLEDGARIGADALADPVEKGAADAAASERAGSEAAADGTGADGGRAGESGATADSVGHPVNPATGEVWTEQTDFVLPGPLPLVFKRVWCSSSGIDGELGHGWSHTLDMALRARPDGRVAARLGDGRFVVFDPPPDGRGSRNVLERLELRRDGRRLFLVDGAARCFEFAAASGDAGGTRRLTRITEPNGHAIALLRDAAGGLSGIVDSAGRRLLVRRDGRDRIAGIEAPAPDGAGTVILVGFSYDAAGDLVAATDACGGRFEYGYERHLLVRERRPAGLTFRFRYDSPARGRAARCLSTWGDNNLFERHLVYDDAARVTTVRSRRGAVERFEWNAMHRVVARTDALGRRRTRSYVGDVLPASETRADGASRARRHDAFGRVVERTDHDGSRTLLRYPEPAPDRPVSFLPDEIVRPGGRVERLAGDGRGNLVRHIDALGRERRFLRDDRGRVVAVRDALGVSRRFGWTERGELAWEGTGDGTRRVELLYDGLGRPSEGRRAGALPTRYNFDSAGRLTEIHRGDGGLVRLTRDPEGRVTSHRDGVGRVTRWEYDGLPVPVRRVNADGTGLLYRYDEDLNLVGLSNAKGEPYVLRYDLADQLVGEVGFDGRERGYAYDAAGFLVAHTDAEGRGAGYRRDPAGRLLERRHADGLFERYEYDPGGALLRATNEWGELGFGYDAVGALLEERGPAGAIRHEYDARGRRVATVLPDGRRIEVAWDSRDAVLAVGFEGREVAAFRRDALGREVARRTGALVTVSEYDPQGRLSRQVGRGRGPAPVLDRSYRWDEADQLAELQDLSSGLRRYEYDACARLVGVEGDLPERFVFDPAGNILGDGADGGATGAAIGDRLLIRGDAKFEYDGCGNRVREVRGAGGGVARRYRYRGDNQLAAVEERSRLGRRVTSFSYDALGRRTEKRSRRWGPEAANDTTDNSTSASVQPPIEQTTRFIWSGDVLLGEGVDTPDSLATVYLHEPGTFRPLAQITRRGAPNPNNLVHYHLDHLGTPREATNDVGEVIWETPLRSRGASTNLLAAQISQPIRFQGQYHDRETDLYYNRFRYYAPKEGCYVQQDPVKLAGGLNAAAYVGNPISWIDPLGLCSISNKANFYVNSNGDVLPSTGYRYMRYLNDDGSVNKYVQGTIESKSAPGSYIGFDKFEAGSAARDAFQIKGPETGNSWSDARLRGSFDTMQLFNKDTGMVDAYVPKEFGDTGTMSEPITSAYPEYGQGGHAQLVTKSMLNFDSVDILPEN